MKEKQRKADVSFKQKLNTQEEEYLKTKKKKKNTLRAMKKSWTESWKVQMSFFRDAVLGQLPPRKILPQPQN